MSGFTELLPLAPEASSRPHTGAGRTCLFSRLEEAQSMGCESAEPASAPGLAAGSGVHRIPINLKYRLAATLDDSRVMTSPATDAELVTARQQSAASLLIEALVDSGVDTFFGIPGGPVAAIFDAVLQHPAARLIESRHETSAVFSAVGYHRASGKVPCILVTAGPGATNAITGIAHAHLERVPMVVICGDVAWAAGGGKLLQDSGPEGIDIEHMLGSITRATIRVAQPSSAAAQTIAALQAATDPRHPGPALLVVPIQHSRTHATPTRIESSTSSQLMAPPPRSAVLEACRLLTRAEHPLIVLGAGCRRYGTILRRMINVLDVPVVTTPQAKGVISERHPRSLRHGGLAASNWARRYTAVGVDVALVLGSDLDDCSVGSTPYLKHGGRLIHVDLDPTVFNRNVPAHIGVIADVGQFAKLMYDVAIEHGLRSHRGSALIPAIHATSPFAVPGFRDDRADIIAPHRAIADLEGAAPGAAFITDIGEHMLFALHYLTAEGPDSFSIGLSLGSMGSGIAAAIGIALARPERPVICICGDGGMQMAGMEILVALQERLPIIYAVFNDARYNMVYHGYRQLFGRSAPWDSPWVDFAGWARSMGINGVRIERPGQITGELIARLAQARIPTVLDIRIDRSVHLAGSGRNETLQHMSILTE